MRNATVFIHIVAVFCSVLILTIPLTSAMQVRTFMPGSREASDTFEVDTKSKVDIDVEVYHDVQDIRWENVEIKVGVVSTDASYEIKKIHLYRCLNLDPDECVERRLPIVAINYLSTEKGSFLWRDVSEGTVANFLTLVQMEHNEKLLWLGFWDQLERKGMQSFVRNDYELDSLDVYVDANASSEWIKNYMERYFMVPFKWTERISLGTAAGEDVESIYLLNANMNLPDPFFRTDVYSTNNLSSVPSWHTFVTGYDKITDALTIFAEPPTTCGDGRCESLFNENAQTCCVDCGCTGEDQECHANADYPNGLCHVCGDGISDPVEDWLNCCADAGCPVNESCDTGVNQPYGTCILPSCDGTRCDSPVENVTNCCTDCGGTDACRTMVGNTFYCDTLVNIAECVVPVCGNDRCEPGEESGGVLACCKDCPDVCPADEYCNETISDLGTCIGLNCGLGGCEPTEDYDNCCLDCGCPGGLVCEAGVCHQCGNYVFEAPAETEQNCCIDTGCSDETQYCANVQDYRCIDEGGMGLNVTLSPDTINCNLADDSVMQLRMEVINIPYSFVGFEEVSYIYGGGKTQIQDCEEQGDSLTCEISTSSGDPEIFRGCFETGVVEFDVNATVAFYRNASTGYTTRELTTNVSVTVGEAREKQCNKIDYCEPWLGEDQTTCCYDCNCPAGALCIEDSCSDAGSISLEVVESTLPQPEDIVCKLDQQRVVNEVTFTANITRRPNSYEDSLRIGSYGITHNGIFYDESSQVISCWEELNNLGAFAGEIACEMPIDYFPPCPLDPNQTLTFEVNITGGGITRHYGWFEVSDSFEINYTKGYPLCGNGDVDGGETSATCCIDAGCPEGEYCALGVGCVNEADMDITVHVSPESDVNCSKYNEAGSNFVRFVAEVDPKPVVRLNHPDSAGMVGFEKTYINQTELEWLMECGFGTINSVESMHVLQCDKPMIKLPACWDLGPKTFIFNTTVLYENITGDLHEVGFSKTVDFNVIEVMPRGCLLDYYCDWDIIGETVDQCCADCGCTGGAICNVSNACNTTDVVLDVGDIDDIDCSEYSSTEFDLTIVNQPYRLTNLRFFVMGVVAGQSYTADLPCQYEGNGNEYSCSMHNALVPLCFVDDPGAGSTRTLTILANITHQDPANGEPLHLEAYGDAEVEVTNILGSCTNPYTGGNPACEVNLGETQQNCCQDCGCSDYGDDYICTLAGCQRIDDIILSISPQNLNAECILIPTEMDWGDLTSFLSFGASVKKLTESKLVKYMCQFKKELEMSANVQNLPYHYQLYESFYYIDGGEPEECFNCMEINLESGETELWLRPVESETRNVPKDHKLKIELTMFTRDATTEARELKLVSNEIDLKYTITESEHLISVENRLKDFEGTVKMMQGIMMILALYTGFCLGCASSLPGLGAIENALAFKSAFFSLPLIGLFFSLHLDSMWSKILLAGMTGAGLGLGVYLATCPFCGVICSTPIVRGLCVVKNIAIGLIIVILLGLDKELTAVKADIDNDIMMAATEVGMDMRGFY
ncbi:MAG: hypothetical protein JSV63_04375 [Candidatus Aenigmatarchaeota archaeon]|nr:MAG: hypothetical protein JSV63_04375 [Candidatus Aenigmarchaeota archaeon]